MCLLIKKDPFSLKKEHIFTTKNNMIRPLKHKGMPLSQEYLVGIGNF